MRTNSMVTRKVSAVILLTGLIFMGTSCILPTDDTEDRVITESSTTYTYDPAHPVIKVDGSVNLAHVTINGLSGQTVFLVKENVSAYESLSSKTGNITVSSVSARSIKNLSPSFSMIGGQDLSNISITPATGFIRYDHEKAREFNSKPLIKKYSSARSAASSSFSGTIPVPSFSYTSGDLKSFWVENSSGVWIEIHATLRSIGTNCYVWVADSNYNETPASNDNKITTAQASLIATNFDKIYLYETEVFGNEYGGGPGGTGGIDGDQKISILVYDIAFDFTAAQNGGTFGFFWAKDMATQSYLDSKGWNLKTNLAEMFYIDSHFTDSAPDMIYSTLIHEFQHMINYNEKVIKPENNNGVETWYNEMLSMVAEDMLDEKIGIGITNFGHPVMCRFPLFNGFYDESGVTDWLPKKDDEVYKSYSSAFAFGAYLARNYGGAALIQKMMDNSTTGISSVTAALSAQTGTTLTFDTAFRKYGEALIFNSASTLSGINSYNKEVISRIGITDYKFANFDLWSQGNELAGGEYFPATYTGPAVWGIGQYTLRPYGLSLQMNSSMYEVTGSITIDCSVPSDKNVELYLMVR